MGPATVTGLDTTRPNPARVHDYLLGGKDNLAADRAGAARVLELIPRFRDIARSGRLFMERAVRHLAGKGITQFLELGAGLPVTPNVHEIARQVTPEARVAYVDNDPVVACHGRALMATDGATLMIEADLRGPAELLARPELRRLIDLTRPVAVLLVSVLDQITDEEDPAGIVAELMSHTAPGSHLVLSHFTGDFDRHRCAALADLTREHGIAVVPRSHAEIQAFFSGLDIPHPGLVQLPFWRLENLRSREGCHVWSYGGVGRKP